MEHRDDLDFAKAFQDAVGAVRLAIERLGVKQCNVELEPVSSPGPDRLALPVLHPRGWFATIICSNDGGFTLQQVHELMLIATRLSVWCIEKSYAPDLPDGTTLTPRQCDVATLAARGFTNPEIADQLGISINTVKVRLKEAFERLFVDNRTELANVLRTWTARPRTPKPNWQPLPAVFPRARGLLERCRDDND